MCQRAYYCRRARAGGRARADGRAQPKNTHKHPTFRALSNQLEVWLQPTCKPLKYPNSVISSWVASTVIVELLSTLKLQV